MESRNGQASDAIDSHSLNRAESGRQPVCVVIVIGTRPEAIKMFPVILALRESAWLMPYVVVTGQHRDMVAPVLKMAGIEPDADLAVARPGQDLNDVVANVVKGLDDLLTELRGGPERRSRPRLFSAATNPGNSYPALTLVHGDTTSAMAGGLASVGARLPVAHVESGLRTGDILSPFPEELNRQVLARLAALHFAPTIANVENLVAERIDGSRVLQTGNTGLDALRLAAEFPVEWQDEHLAAALSGADPVLVVTAHRRENLGSGIRGIAQAVAAIARARPDLKVVWPMHPNPTVREQVIPALSDRPNVLLTEPMDYAHFAHLLSRATLAITDSGGIQEEAPSVGTPVLVARDTSERPEGVAAGTLRLVGTDPHHVAAQALQLLADETEYQAMQDATNPFGDGFAAQRIVTALEHLVFGDLAVDTSPGFSREAVLEFAGYSDAEIAETQRRVLATVPQARQGSHETLRPASVR